MNCGAGVNAYCCIDSLISIPVVNQKSETIMEDTKEFYGYARIAREHSKCSNIYDLRANRWESFSAQTVSEGWQANFRSIWRPLERSGPRLPRSLMLGWGVNQSLCQAVIPANLARRSRRHFMPVRVRPAS